MKKYYAYCRDHDWSGPDRDTYDEANEDRKAYRKKHGPQLIILIIETYSVKSYGREYTKSRQYRKSR